MSQSDDEEYENCGNCKFGYDPDGGGIIECRRYAPKPVVLTEYYEDREAQDKSQYRVAFIHWSSVEKTTWCGEWKST